MQAVHHSSGLRHMASLLLGSQLCCSQDMSNDEPIVAKDEQSQMRASHEEQDFGKARIGASSSVPPRFEFERHFSREIYDEFVKRSLRTSDLVERIKAATVQAQATATGVRRYGYNWKTPLHEKGEITFLSENLHVVTAFSNRCDIDHRYLSSGQFDWLDDEHLHLRGKDGKWKKVGKKLLSGARPSSVPKGQVFYKVFGDHDVALLFFNVDDAASVRRGPTVGIETPERELEEYLSAASQVFDRRMVVVSERCLSRIKRDLADRRQGSWFEFVVSIYVSRGLALLLPPGRSSPSLVSEVTKDIIASHATNSLSSLLMRSNPQDLESGRGSRFGPLSEPESYWSTGEFVGGLLLLTGGSDYALAPRAVRLIGVRFPEKQDEKDAIREFFRQTVSGLRLQFIRFDSYDNHHEAGALYVPEASTAVNYELIRHGLARVDLFDKGSIDAFPELIFAAHTALAEGIGFARRWSTDKDYVHALEQLLRSSPEGSPSRPHRAATPQALPRIPANTTP